MLTDEEDRFVFIPKNDSAFPREIAFPQRRTVESWDEFKERFNNQIKHSSVFVTLFGFKSVQDNGYTPNYRSAVIDNLYLDIDPEGEPEECWKETKRIHKYLKKQDIRHNVVFSGGGFHIYARTNNPELVNKKATLYNAVMSMVEELELEYCDPAVVGDLSRITRVPNSYNFKEKRQRFCIPLGEQHMNMTYDEICEEAQEQNWDYDTWGTQKIDLSEFDSDKKQFNRVNRDAPQFSKDYSRGDLSIGDIEIPRCIQRLLEKGKEGGHLEYRDRFIILMWFKERGLSMEETADFLKEHMLGGKDDREENDWEHMMGEYPHEHGMIGYIWDRDMKFLTHDRLVNEGYCEPEWGECQNSLYWGRGESSEEVEELEGYKVEWSEDDLKKEEKSEAL